MRVGVVGAGMAGLAAARELRARAHEVVLFEKATEVGGRVATYRRDGYTWDTGATLISPRGKALERVMLEELPRDDLRRIDLRVDLHHALRALPGDPRRDTPRYCYASGADALPRLLADGLDVRCGRAIERLERTGDGFAILGEGFDALVLTPPPPHADALLWSLGETRPLSGVSYRSCLSVLLGYSAPLPETPYSALLDPDQRHPLTWLSLESAKAPGRAPAGGSAFCAQLSPTFSAENFDREEDWLADVASSYLARLYGADFASPEAFAVVRWRRSQPESMAAFGRVNRPGDRVVVASDALAGGHVEDAFEVGLRAARLLDGAR